MGIIKWSWARIKLRRRWVGMNFIEIEFACCNITNGV